MNMTCSSIFCKFKVKLPLQIKKDLNWHSGLMDNPMEPYSRSISQVQGDISMRKEYSWA